MPNLTNLTDEECDFLFEVLKRQESLPHLPANNDREGPDARERILKDLLYRLDVACSSKNAPVREGENVLVEERLAGYC